MLYSIIKRKDLENLNKLVSLNNQKDELRLQNKLGKQNFHGKMKKLFESLTNTIKDASRNISKTITETSIKNNKDLENLNNKHLEIMNERGISATYLMSPLSKVTNPENNSQFKLIKDPNSSRIKDLLIHKTIKITLYNNL